MMKTYKSWLTQFANHDLLDFTLTEEGLWWLKLRSIERKELLSRFVVRAGLAVDLKARDKMERLWKLLSENNDIRLALAEFLSDCQEAENLSIDETFEKIRSNLYQMEDFHWGGGFRNSLDKAIVSRYVKTDAIIPYCQLEGICDGELREMSRGYLLNSWYDYWSSVLIENIFRHCAGVISAPGKIKNVDFFVDDVPFDLKVTYMPREFAKLKMKDWNLPDPFRRLKAFAKERGIPFSGADEMHQRYEIEERIRDAGTADGLSLLGSIRADWVSFVQRVRDCPDVLIRWLYENQGDMRFGAENRIFLILVDMDDPRDSWKLKRNVDLIKPRVEEWIGAFKRELVSDYKTVFKFGGRTYRTFSDAIFVCKGDSV